MPADELLDDAATAVYEALFGHVSREEDLGAQLELQLADGFLLDELEKPLLALCLGRPAEGVLGRKDERHAGERGEPLAERPKKRNDARLSGAAGTSTKWWKASS